MSHPEQATEASHQEFDAGGRQREMAEILEAAADRISSPQRHSEHFIARRIGEEARSNAADQLRERADELREPPPEKTLDERVLESLRPAS